MKKYKVLVVGSDRTGVGYFRSSKPHIRLQEMYPEEFHIDIDYQPNLDNDEFLKQYDIIHYHRTIGAYENVRNLLDRLDNLGVVSIMDIDDYWDPGPHHPSYSLIKSKGIDKLILENIRSARNITTTTSIFADEIKKQNKNVFVLENGIDPREKQFQSNPEPSDRIRIGWLGGSSHFHDLSLLNGLVSKLQGDGLIDKIQFVLCGFDTRGSVTMIDQKTGQQTQRAIKPEESVWCRYEEIFTNNYKTVSPKYREYLLRYTKDEEFDASNESYRRVWTKPISSYASNYNLFDISLAPIEENMFNKVKSQLKVVESGFHKKAIIAQDFGPYKIDINTAWEKGEGIQNGNGLLVDNNRNHKDWHKYIKKLIDNPEKIKELGNSLYETVNSKYHIDILTEKRKDLYIKLIESKNAQTKGESREKYENIS
jgi:glycosyltransferase involved in cell wall biosynthesis